MTNFADNVIQFNQNLDFHGKLEPGTKVLNPFNGNPEVLSLSHQFYRKYYNDSKPRKIILGINPGRLGAGSTGIPFTDTKRLTEVCGIPVSGMHTHEPSSVFVYDVIAQYGGCEKFYGDFYINSVCPLGFVKKNGKGNWINYNYYDDQGLFDAAKAFMVSSLKKQIAMGIDTSVCYVLGKKNAKFLNRINEDENLFDTLCVLDHPRYIMQYKMKLKDTYIDEYLKALWNA
jgi:hypothetical protein